MNPRGLALDVAVDHERLSIVDQHRLRDPAEMTEQICEFFAPIVVALTLKERLQVLAAGVSEHGAEQHHAHPLLGDPNPLLDEIDLQLMARSCLEPHRRNLGGAFGLAMRSHDTLDGPRMNLDTALGEKVSNDDRITLGRRLE